MALSYKDIQDLPFYKKFLALIAVLAILFGLFYYFFYLPRLHEVANLKRQCRELDQQIALKKRQVRDIEQFRREFKALLRDYELSLRQLPDKEMIDKILMDIAKFERKENLESVLFKPKNEIKKSFYAVVPMQIKIRGTYHQIGKFFEDIAELPRVVNVKAFKFANPKDEGGVVLLMADCAIETYRYVSVKERSGKKEKNNGKREK